MPEPDCFSENEHAVAQDERKHLTRNHFLLWKFSKTHLKQFSFLELGRTTPDHLLKFEGVKTRVGKCWEVDWENTNCVSGIMQTFCAIVSREWLHAPMCKTLETIIRHAKNVAVSVVFTENGLTKNSNKTVISQSVYSLVMVIAHVDTSKKANTPPANPIRGSLSCHRPTQRHHECRDRKLIALAEPILALIL